MVEFHAFTKLDVFQPPFVRSLVPLPRHLHGGYLHQSPHRRRRKRGKRAGTQVKLRWLWKQGFAFNPVLLSEATATVGSPSPWPSTTPGTRFSCLRPVFPDLVTPCWPTAPYPGKRLLCLGGRKADSRCLRPLPRASAATAVAGSVGLPLKMALINARSIGNKSFILNEVFSSRAWIFVCGGDLAEE
ncbi:hypothetical protein AAFF_G00302890 [Aldrovandia affinis]|uniref:Uncharacterized protein n=1 Tax=Aldrovandia affinis TaxID=143900 RepID=A0AAD7R913_9TELE|nr:hypothetical protein AAFF_G00302890 [Aldrovandia affinis]